MPALLRWVNVRRPSGALVLRTPAAGAAVATVHVRDGDAVFATSARREARPGESVEAFVRSVVLDMFELRDAVPAFDAPTAVFDATRVTAASLLVAGVVRAPQEQLLEWAGDLDEPLACARDPFLVLAGEKLEAHDARLLSGFAGPTSMREAVGGSPSPRATLALLVALRYCDVLVSAGAPRPWIGDADPFPPAGGFDIEEVAQTCYLVEEKLRGLDGGADHYALLEVERRASGERIKASFRELAKRFHPDRHAQLASHDPQLKARLDRLFAAITGAYDVLADPRGREDYDRSLATRDQARAVRTAAPRRHVPKPIRPAAAARAHARSAAASSPPPPAASPARSAHQPAPPRPGVTAPPRAAPAARPADPPPAESRPAERAAARAAGDPAPHRPAAPGLDAARVAEFGRRCLADGDTARAVLAFRKAIELDPAAPAHHAELGRALIAGEGMTRQAEAALHRAVELSPGAADLLVEVAELYAEQDRPADARILFTRALRLDPSNDTARTALGLGRQRAAGLMDRLRRK